MKIIEIPLAQKWAFLISYTTYKGMRKILLFAATLCAGIGMADAAVRIASNLSRTPATPASQSQSVVSRASGVVGAQSRATTARSNANVTTSRTGVHTAGRTASTKTIARTASTTTARATASRATVATTPARSGTTTNTTRSARAATITSATGTNTFGTGYNACRDAYFTCMDQFCAKQNDTYRRCVCSSKLTEIQSRERALTNASDNLQDFKNLNIEIIPKTAAEVNAMLTTSTGELVASSARDKSASATALSGISEVLSNAKSKSLSTSGTLDIAGDINAIWSTTDLADGANISNLTGEPLYNAVHAQCAEMVSANCPSSTVLGMVVSAYGMYIENDCSALITALDKKLNTANSTIRSTEREMNTARLENYNAHNSTSINDCIAQVRSDITADTACGKDYVHCLDISGKYLNRDTGTPIYTTNFYQLENQISLSGDVLTNPTNRMIVAELNNKRAYAARGLDTCRELSDEVWDEFMRQAIVEIYQGQQSRVRDVKNECLDVVNACYDEQSKSLKDFSNVKEQLLIGSRLELSEELCKEKLYACSNLYGDGNGNGLDLLVNAMRNITDQKIGKECLTTLQEFVQDTCAVPNNDSLHNYPYACRVYAPGSQKYAAISTCNQRVWNDTGSASTSPDTSEDQTTPEPGWLKDNEYMCHLESTFYECSEGYYMVAQNDKGEWKYNSDEIAGNYCFRCPAAATSCPGGKAAPIYASESQDICGTDYIGSLYQKVVRYAMQACVRPSESSKGDYVLPTTIMQDVNVVMDSVRVTMAKELSTECDRLGGVWVDTPWVDVQRDADGQLDGLHDYTGDAQYKLFYTETSANTQWGYCRPPKDTDTVSANNDTGTGGGTGDETGDGTGDSTGDSTGDGTGGGDTGGDDSGTDTPS